MVGRDENGKFKKGEYKGGPGRPSREREIEYYRILTSAVSPDDWRIICAKAVEEAKKGDAIARKFLSDYLIGTPPQRQEHTGANGAPLKIIVEYASDHTPESDD